MLSDELKLIRLSHHLIDISLRTRYRPNMPWQDLMVWWYFESTAEFFGKCAVGCLSFHSDEKNVPTSRGLSAVIEMIAWFCYSNGMQGYLDTYSGSEYKIDKEIQGLI